jgi:hypothetical protein
MSRTPSLISERDSILSRMQASRNEYRRLLMHESGVAHTPMHASQLTHEPTHVENASYASTHPHRPPALRSNPVSRSNPYMDVASDTANSALSWMKAHPLLCAAAVVTIVAIGPRRVMRTAVRSGGSMAALTLRNPQNIDALTRAITSITEYVQRGHRR